ncbi:protein kinase domain-containing protein [Salana multivorans]
MAAEGDVVGGYTLVRRLGAGGMGAVWEAQDGRGGTVALKLLHPAISADPDARVRLAREVANLNRLRGARVSRVLDAELEGDLPFVVTELIDGLTLEDSVSQEGPFDPVDLYPLATGLAEAVTAVHRAGLMHRDIKPGNVMVTYSGPVLIDFGIAQLAEDTRLTHTGFVTGTPGYLDPATLSGGELGAEGDWYSFAAVLLFAATGRAPFGRERMEVVLARMTAGTPDVAGLPGLVASAFTAALARDPAARPAPRELIAILRRWAEGKSVDAPVTIPGVAGPGSRPTTPMAPLRSSSGSASSGSTASRPGTPVSSPPTTTATGPPPPSFAPGSGRASATRSGGGQGVAGGQDTASESGQTMPGPLGPMQPGPFGQPGQRVPESWELPPPARRWLVLWSGAVVVVLAILWSGVAAVLAVVGFVLLTAAGLTERRTRRRRLAAGRRRSDPVGGHGMVAPDARAGSAHRRRATAHRRARGGVRVVDRVEHRAHGHRRGGPRRAVLAGDPGRPRVRAGRSLVGAARRGDPDRGPGLLGHPGADARQRRGLGLVPGDRRSRARAHGDRERRPRGGADGVERHLVAAAGTAGPVEQRLLTV